MSSLRISLATLVVASSLVGFAIARAEAAPVPLPPLPSTQAVPTPAPGGTPVTFGTPKLIGSPLPLAPGTPIATSVPTTSPNGDSASFRQKHEVFVVGDYLLQPKVYNELSHGQQSTQADYALRGAAEFNIADLPLMIEGEVRRYTYRHESGFVTQPGRATQAFVPAVEARDDDIDGRLGIKLLEPRIYLGLAYLNKRNNAGTTQLVGPGIGLEKLPDYEAPLGVYFSAYFYPNIVGQQTVTTVTGAQLATLRYRVLTYQLGFSLAPGKSPIFIDIGALGDRMTARGNAPSNETHLAPYAGIGFFSY
jgi:hypothetical protein